jgi:putative alpha-1,2-mannosidase
MFNSESKTTGREQVDVTGLIGQYAHGNEPSHHMAYLYNYIDKPENKRKKHYILDNFYKMHLDGLIGNEDCGQMSAWYVLSSMGIYQVTLEQSVAETTLSFDKIKVNFENRTEAILKPSEAIDLISGFSCQNRVSGNIESDIEKLSSARHCQ